MTTASILAKYLIASCSGNGKTITNLKLQKLLYYAQAWQLALHNKALFNDRIEAWVHGPVVPTVFREYRDFKWDPLPVDQSRPEPNNEVRSHIAEVLAAYGKFDATQLEQLTHSEDPWKEARKGIPGDMASTNEISKESMLNYYRARLNG
jgi:uncharacterized phage-associated protein